MAYYKLGIALPLVIISLFECNSCKSNIMMLIIDDMGSFTTYILGFKYYIVFVDD